jgi:hypothetical protein
MSATSNVTLLSSERHALIAKTRAEKTAVTSIASGKGIAQCAHCYGCLAKTDTVLEMRRGSAGRFIPAIELDHQSLSNASANHPSHFAGPNINRSTKTAQEAEFSLDLAKLYKSEASSAPVVAQMRSICRVHPMRCRNLPSLGLQNPG